MDYKEKYLKYKLKYLKLQHELFGGDDDKIDCKENVLCQKIKELKKKTLAIHKCPENPCPFSETLKYKINTYINSNVSTIPTADDMNVYIDKMKEIATIIKQNIPIKYIDDIRKCIDNTQKQECT